MDGTTRVTRMPGMIEADAGGELVGLHVDRGICYGFNATATRVWQLLEEPRSVDELVAEYDVEEAECRAGVAELLASLRDERLVALDPT